MRRTLRWLGVALLVGACQTDVPVAGREVWGTEDGDMTLIPMGTTLTEIVADPRRPYLYATDFDHGQLYVIDAARSRVHRRLTVGSRPADASLGAGGDRLYVALSGGSEIAVVDLQTQSLLPSLRLSFSPAYVAAAGRSGRLFVTSVLEFWKGFPTYGATFQVDGDGERQLSSIGLLEVDVERQFLYVASHRSLYQYDISGPRPALVDSVAAEGPVLDLHLSADGTRLYSVSAGYFATPERIISHGLLDSQLNFDVDYVEAFATAGMTKVGELYTGAFPRAVTSAGDWVVVAAGDSARLSGFAVLFDAATLTPAGTFRLVGPPASGAAIDPSSGTLYLAVNNPYDIRERFGQRQDLQVVSLAGVAPWTGGGPAAGGADPGVAGDGPVVSGGLDGGIPDPGDGGGPDPGDGGGPDPAPSSREGRGLGDRFLWQPAAGKPHQMVLVPGGRFVMGSDEGDSDEQPVHVVDVDAFYIDAFEVTVGQYRACVEDGACEPPSSASSCNWYDSMPEDHPVNCMFWADADTYCRWAGLRLPSEAEWEKAARGVDARTFPWGEDFDRSRANYGDGGIMRTTPVDAYADGVSPYGAWDMAGNVWDWVADWYHEHYYANSPPHNPTGPESGSLRVLRGGSHWFGPDLMRSANREPYHPQQTDVDIGFRCGRDASAVPAPQRR